MDLVSLQRHWHEFGVTDPLWAVLTDNRFKGNRWDPIVFFQSGENEIKSIISRLERIEARFPRRRALDFGCAVGRLTQALCAYFERVDGVDIAPSMIEQAKRYNQYGDRCHYYLNAVDNLGIFADNQYDFIYSRLVLQHMEPRYAEKYIREFIRVLVPGGVAVFQVPAHRIDSEPATGYRILPEAAFKASLQMLRPLPALSAGESCDVALRVTNLSAISWPSQEQQGGVYYLSLGNHWLTGNGQVVNYDDGRTVFQKELRPTESADFTIRITAPRKGGNYVLEFDLVQEGIAWFKTKGSPTLQVPIVVRPSTTSPETAFSAVMEVYAMPKAYVVSVVEDAGGKPLDISRDDAAGGLAGYLYIVTKLGAAGAGLPVNCRDVPRPEPHPADSPILPTSNLLRLVCSLAQTLDRQTRISATLAGRLIALENKVEKLTNNSR